VRCASGVFDRVSIRMSRIGKMAPRGCMHPGAAAEWGGVDHSGPRVKCGPTIIGAPILGPLFWDGVRPNRARAGRPQGACTQVAGLT